MKLTLVLACASSAAIGFAVARWSAARPPAAIMPAPAAPVVSRAGSSCAATLSRADLAALKQELLEAIAERGASPSPAAPPAPEPVVADVAAAAAADEVVARALAAGVWNDDSARELRQAVANLADASRQDVIAKLIVAINEQRVRVVTDGPLL